MYIKILLSEINNFNEIILMLILCDLFKLLSII